jgi:hypothetical protein
MSAPKASSAARAPSGGVEDVTERLLAYLEEWNDGTGRYLSPIVHRGNLKRVSDIHDTPWCQAPIICGYLALVRANPLLDWRNRLLAAVDAQCDNATSDGRFVNAGHEDDRFSSLVHNALANIALFRFSAYAPTSHDDTAEWQQLRERARRVALANVEYVIAKLWSESFGAFKFDRVDHYSGSAEHFVLNMNALMIESLVCAIRATGDRGRYEPYVAPVVRWFDRQLAAAGGDRIPYSNLVEKEITIYTALFARGLAALQEYLRDGDAVGGELNALSPVVGRILERCGRAIDVQRLSDASNYAHGVYEGQKTTFPLFRSGAGIIVSARDQLHALRGEAAARRSLIDVLLRIAETSQRCRGGLANYRGYNTTDNFRRASGGDVWEDTLPTPGWNGFFLEAAVGLMSEEERRRVRPGAHSRCRADVALSPRYCWLETGSLLLVLGWWPLRSVALYAFRKRHRKPLVWLDLRRVRRKLRPSYYCN